jgi:uncharacterized protein
VSPAPDGAEPGPSPAPDGAEPGPGPAVPPADLVRAAARFGAALRRAGVGADASRVQRYVEALEVLGPRTMADCYWAGRAVLVAKPDDFAAYDTVFAACFGIPVPLAALPGPELTVPITLALDAGDDGDAPPDDDGDQPEGEVVTVRWSGTEHLRTKDFATYTAAEHAEARRLMADLRLRGALRRSRRLVPARRGQLHLGPTLRMAVRHGGEATVLRHRAPGLRPRRVVLLCDISGSMEPYARALLRFLHSAVVGHGKVEAFTIGTRLTRVTRELGSRDPDAALAAASRAVADWSGGTRLGDVIGEFVDTWGRRGMARGAIVVILSDGWDRGDPGILGRHMARLARLAHRVVWVNPLKATPGFAPLAGGMAAALPHVDVFIEGHSLASLEHLVAVVADETARV